MHKNALVCGRFCFHKSLKSQDRKKIFSILADSYAEATTSCSTQKAAHKVDAVGWREWGQQAHRKTSQKSEDWISRRMSHLRKQWQTQNSNSRCATENRITDTLRSWGSESRDGECPHFILCFTDFALMPLVCMILYIIPTLWTYIEKSDTSCLVCLQADFVTIQQPSFHFTILFLWPLPKDNAAP